VQSLVKLMNGQINLESQEGKGSVFRVMLSVKKSLSSPTILPGSPTFALAEMNRAKGSGKALRILLVEDNLMNQRMMCRLLQNRGHFVATACDGLAALEIFKTQPLDLVLMDVHMPVMDGFTVTAEIRAMEKHRDRPIPIVAMTAKTMRGDREACLEAGMDDYLAKPLRPEELWAVLDRFSNKSTMQTPNESVRIGQSMPADVVFDEPSALARVEGNRELFAELIGIFLEEWPRILEKTIDSLAKRDWPALQRHLHNAKGLTANLGGFAAAAAAKETEKRIKDGRLDTLDSDVEVLLQAVENLRLALVEAYPEALIGQK
jgi:CheY-like chemotaxis protein